ncbi:MAG: hypothetical protein LBG47_06245 [Prevotellaceae bacterium]|nr:hypothetical protein [Prevotellaceae bacterium]
MNFELRKARVGNAVEAHRSAQKRTEAHKGAQKRTEAHRSAQKRTEAHRGAQRRMACLSIIPSPKCT